MFSLHLLQAFYNSPVIIISFRWIMDNEALVNKGVP